MQGYDFKSPRFIESFPRCVEGSVIEKYQQLLAQLFPDHGMFMLLLNASGDLFVDVAASHYTFEHPDILLHQLTNGTDILITEDLSKKPFQGIFCADAEQHVRFFICCRMNTSDGRLIGGFGVFSEKAKVVLPDEKIFLQWLSENLSSEIAVQDDKLPEMVTSSSDELQQHIVAYLDDIYLMVDKDSSIISIAEQVPAFIKKSIQRQGNSLLALFGEKNYTVLSDLIKLSDLSSKKQNGFLSFFYRATDYLFSVSCNRFSEGWFLLTFHDVTERNRLREILENRKQLLENIIQAGNIGILVVDSDGYINYHNKRGATWFDVTDSAKQMKLSPEHWYDGLNSADTVSPFKQLFQLKQDLKDSWYRCHIASGEFKTFSINAVYTELHGRGQSSGTFFIQDVTERALLEQAMIEMEQQMQFLLQASPVIIYQMLASPYNQLTYISPNCQNILGYSQLDILNDTEFWLKHVHPNDKANITAFTRSVDLDMQTCEYRFWFEHLGSYRWIKDIRRMTTENENHSWIGALLDITERKEAEHNNMALQKELAATLASLVDAVITIDKHGVIQDFNPATCRMFGYQAEQLLGQNVAMLMPIKIGQHHQEYVERYINTHEPRIIGIGREVQAFHAKGHEFPVSLSIAVIGEGDNTRFVGSCHDLSQIKKQQEQLLHSEKLGAVGKLTSSIAHDFNNILGIVRGYAEMLQHEGEHVAKLSLPIIEASDRASVMISQLLDFSSSKKRDVNLIEVNSHLLSLKPLLEKALTPQIELIYQLSSEAYGISVELTAFDNLMINMAVNANHAMKGSGTLTITTSLENAASLPKELDLTAGKYVKIAIADTGSGMTEEVRKKIFEPFFTTKGDKGTGLGLAQAYGMIHRCAGAIDVQTAVGSGTTFELYLPEIRLPSSMPVMKAKPAGPTFASKSLQVSSASAQSSNAKVILLVDDETELLEMNAMLLETAGYDVVKANSGAQALQLISQHSVALLLSDIMMPEMNGFELAKKIKASYPLIQVQLISGFADKSMITDEECLTWYDQRLCKPVPMTALLQRVSEILQ